MADEYYVNIDDVIRETDDAILVKLSADEKSVVKVEGKDEIWIPKSVIHDDSEVFELNDSGTLIVQGWLARKRGWE